MDIRTRAFTVQRPTPARPVASPAHRSVTAPLVPQAVARVASVPGPYASAVEQLKSAIAREAKLPLQPGAESRVYLHPDRPAKGTIVMYHGFTAGTWQFELLAQKAFDQGYNVFIPRLPGHGMKDASGVEDPTRLVGAGQQQVYQDFAEETYQQAKALGGPVHVMGLSVGGNIALAVAEKHADVASVTAYAPFLRPRAGLLFDAFHLLDKVTFGQASKLLNLIPFKWDEQTRLDTASGKRPGHSKFDVGNLQAASELGRALVKDAGKIQAPVQYFVTGADDAVDNAALRKAHDQGGAERNGWYEYPAAEGIPHPMVHPMEDKGKGHIDRLYAMTLQFLETGKPIDRE
jgi:alpha-beta hydrolase superfamily lysophospholipase